MGWGRVGWELGQVSMRGTLEAQKEWKEFALILSEWEGFLQGVEQGEVTWYVFRRMTPGAPQRLDGRWGGACCPWEEVTETVPGQLL